MQQIVWQNVFIQTLWLELQTKAFCICMAWTLLT